MKQDDRDRLILDALLTLADQAALGDLEPDEVKHWLRQRYVAFEILCIKFGDEQVSAVVDAAVATMAAS